MLPKIRFSYQNDDYYAIREVVCTKLTVAASTVLSLPDEIVIRFANLGESIYGNTALDFRCRNRVSINQSLTISELAPVLIHELIHLNQIHTGILRASRTGVYFWNNRQYKVDTVYMNFETHQQLPWEIDVTNRLPSVLKESLAAGMKLG